MKLDKLEQERMLHDPKNYVLGQLYFNPKDKRIIVPKLNALFGWTVNFASPFSYLIIIGFVGFLIIINKIISR